MRALGVRLDDDRRVAELGTGSRPARGAGGWQRGRSDSWQAGAGEPGVERVDVYVDPRNAASLSVAEKAGFCPARGRPARADFRGGRAGSCGSAGPSTFDPMAQQYIFTMQRLTKVLPAGQGGAQGHHPGVPARREDRRARAQRRREVDAAADHGRRGHRVPRRRAARPRRHRRAARAGAGARRGQGRARERRGRRRRGQARCSTASTSCRPTTPTRRPTSSRRLQEQIDAVDAWNLDTHARASPWTRCACRPPTPTSPRSPAASAAASRCAGCCCASPTCCSSTSRPTTSTPRSVAWLERHLADYPGTVVAVTHDRYFLDNVAGWILELDRGRGIPFEGNYSSWLEQKQARLAQEKREESARQRTIEQELEWVRHERHARGDQAQGAPEPLRGAARRGPQRQARQGPDPHPAPARGWATWSSRPTACARATATGC